MKLIKYYSIIKKLKSDKEREEKKDSMKKKKLHKLSEKNAEIILENTKSQILLKTIMKNIIYTNKILKNIKKKHVCHRKRNNEREK